ncbi:hypothetical protein H012_gp175 [Acanthamoeba polyphaga moumouvirus]|uniref:2OG-Fe(II) oxygenase n=2 Tax=Moumouvirus TaxID=3080801 RepID=L7RDB3_9VIRU|nr:hypothetical protein H012_gp175 [Acanthamoeba polyphaga moumouvirus]AGC02276.1 hypothetical protein Moumou_00757 [Acanthamoeba polyphaga moumouvirus]
MTSTFTITFGDQAENHVGMQKIGSLSNNGYNLSDLINIRKYLSDKNIKSDIFDLNYVLEKLNIYPDNEAYILVINDGVNKLINKTTSNNIFKELDNLTWDSKALMYGRVVNKNARYNLCFGDISQKPNYEEGRGTIISFNSVPVLKILKEKIKEFTGDNLVAEGNYYYDINKCGIGYHGDSERKKVIGVRIGQSIPLVYQWYYQLKPIGEPVIFEFNDGDIYIMSEKATGNDWKCKNKYTLRHAAGCSKYTNI